MKAAVCPEPHPYLGHFPGPSCFLGFLEGSGFRIHLTPRRSYHTLPGRRQPLQSSGVESGREDRQEFTELWGWKPAHRSAFEISNS